MTAYADRIDHYHTCTLCEPDRVYSCVKKHRRKHMTMLNVWYLCPTKSHVGAPEYREAQSGVVSFEHEPKLVIVPARGHRRACYVEYGRLEERAAMFCAAIHEHRENYND